MNILTIKSAQLFTKGLRFPSVSSPSASRNTPLFRFVVPIVPSRFYAKKTIDAVPVKSESKRDAPKKVQKTQHPLFPLIDQELTLLKATATQDGEQSLSSEYIKDYLEESHFKLEEDNAYIRLRKTQGNKTILVSFKDRLEPQEENPEPENESEQQEEEEEEEEGEEEEDTNGLDYDHNFIVEISTSNAGKNTKLSFDCYAISDGSFVVTHVNSGTGKSIPVDISHWTSETRDGLIEFLGSWSVDEKLAQFIIQYLEHRRHEDNTVVLNDFKNFLSDS